MQPSQVTLTYLSHLGGTFCFSVMWRLGAVVFGDSLQPLLLGARRAQVLLSDV